MKANDFIVHVVVTLVRQTVPKLIQEINVDLHIKRWIERKLMDVQIENGVGGGGKGPLICSFKI